MDNPDLISQIPSWAKYTGGSLGVVAAGALWLRQWLSSAKVDRSIDTEAVQTIARLTAQVESERKRADDLMHEREAMATEIGQLRGEVLALRQQVEMLVAMVQQKPTPLTGVLPALPALPEPAAAESAPAIDGASA